MHVCVIIRTTKSKFYAPRTGVYQITSQACFAGNQGGNATVSIMINGSDKQVWAASALAPVSGASYWYC
jgi:hypothetical protein